MRTALLIALLIGLVGGCESDTPDDLMQRYLSEANSLAEKVEQGVPAAELQEDKQRVNEALAKIEKLPSTVRSQLMQRHFVALEKVIERQTRATIRQMDASIQQMEAEIRQHGGLEQ